MEREIRDPWDQLRDEPDTEYEIFTEYRDFGPTRSIKLTADSFNLKQKQVIAVANKYNWISRVTSFDDSRSVGQKKLSVVRLMDDKDLENRYNILGLKLLQKAEKALIDKPNKDLTGSEIAKMIVLGTDLVERARVMSNSGMTSKHTVESINEGITNLVRKSIGHKSVKPDVIDIPASRWVSTSQEVVDITAEDLPTLDDL